LCGLVARLSLSYKSCMSPGWLVRLSTRVRWRVVLPEVRILSVLTNQTIGDAMSVHRIIGETLEDDVAFTKFGPKRERMSEL
jgi:hypothetical protein